LSNNDNFAGYKEKTIEFLTKFKAKTWSKIEITNSTGSATGVILPRNEFAPDGFVELKLKNGYNIGILLDSETSIKVIGQEKPMEVKFDQIQPLKNPKLPSVRLLGIGGTISSRLDYVTGAVIPAFEPGELFTAVPELSNICNLETDVLYQIFSENMKAEYWLNTAQKIAKLANSGVDGILLAHGTDTMSYTSSALSFLLQDLSIPVVIVGSQRSSDRPSSDAAMNLLNSATLAGHGDLAEVVVCMLGSSSHDYGLIHRGTRVRKMHSSRRDAFRTIGESPLGMVDGNTIRFFSDNYNHRPKSQIQTVAASKIEEKVGLIYTHPDMPSDLIDYYIDKNFKGLVIAGTGLGHMPSNSYPALERAKEAQIPIVMTVQTLWGYTGMDVYETGRRLQSYGVIPGKNMLPEVAFTKLSWILGNFEDFDEIKSKITTNIAGEITEREPMNGYLVNQGIESKIPPFLTKFKSPKSPKSAKPQKPKKNEKRK
jgi:glutamyl-tRNA(Gln) amidotransferase subunit D